MQYFIFPILLIIYFEFLGRTLCFYLGKIVCSTIYFPLGFVFTLAIGYMLMWPFAITGSSFYVVLFFSMILFVVSVILIIKSFDKIDKRINIKIYLIV